MLFRSITSHPSNPLSATALTELRRNTALATFNAQMAAETGITSQSAQMTEITNGVQVSGSGVANNVFGGLLGITSSNIAVTSAATSRLLSDRLEVAFVLDNTGSMASLNKMPLLKASMHKFLMKLQSGQSSISDVKVSLVPFDTKVRIDPIFATGKPWMRQSAIELLGWGGCIEDRVIGIVMEMGFVAQPYHHAIQFETESLERVSKRLRRFEIRLRHGPSPKIPIKETTPAANALESGC